MRIAGISVPERLIKKPLTRCLIPELIIQVDVVDLQLTCKAPELPVEIQRNLFAIFERFKDYALIDE